MKKLILLFACIFFLISCDFIDADKTFGDAYFTKSISLSLGVTYYKAIKPKGDEVSDVLTRSALKVQLW